MRKLLLIPVFILALSCSGENKSSVEVESADTELQTESAENLVDSAEFNSVAKTDEQTAENADSNYGKYCNERFEFCVEYPKELIPQGQSQNGDGQSFKSEDGMVELVTYGSLYDSEYTTLGTRFESEQNQIGREVKYKVKKDNFYVVSGWYSDDGESIIFYTKTVDRVLDYARVLITYTIEYPEYLASTYDPYCEKINKDLK